MSSPWIDYEHIWPSKSKFFTWLRGCLRRSVWNRSPIKIEYKNSKCSKPPKGYKGRAKSGAHCELTGEWEGKSKLEVDHITGGAQLNDWSDLEDFVKHLVPAPGKLAVVTKEAHKIKSYAERMGISYEEAAIKKAVIAKMKQPVEDQKDELKQHGFIEQEISNAKLREKCYIKVIRHEA